MCGYELCYAATTCGIYVQLTTGTRGTIQGEGEKITETAEDFKRYQFVLD